jgi:hypothetical protein
MNFPEDILCDIFSFLDWMEFYKVIKYFKYDIPQQLIRYNKSNISLKYMTIDNMCLRPYEYLEIVQFLYSIGVKCSTDAMDYASANGYLKIVKFLHSIDAKCTSSAMCWASKSGHLETVKYLHKNFKKVFNQTIDAMDLASENGHLETVEFLKSIKN